MEIPDPVGPPLGGQFTPGGGFVDGFYYDLILETAPYQVFHVNGAILVRGHAELRVNNIHSLSVEIAEGASLRLYGGGSTTVLGGLILGQNVAVLNRTGNAANFVFVSLSSEQILRVQTSAPIIGTIYAPGADLEIEGDPATGLEFVGSCWAKSLRLKSPLNLHYDENLTRLPFAPEQCRPTEFASNIQGVGDRCFEFLNQQPASEHATSLLWCHLHLQPCEAFEQEATEKTEEAICGQVLASQSRMANFRSLRSLRWLPFKSRPVLRTGSAS